VSTFQTACRDPSAYELSCLDKAYEHWAVIRTDHIGLGLGQLHAMALGTCGRKGNKRAPDRSSTSSNESAVRVLEQSTKRKQSRGLL